MLSVEVFQQFTVPPESWDGLRDQSTMRKFDMPCLETPIFARYLNTSESTVQKWESGRKQPSGMALKLLAVVQKNGLKFLA